jgi:nitronate monooxygenase
MITRWFSGRPGRSIEAAYVRAAAEPTAPTPAPYPVQRGLTQAMRDTAVKKNDIERMQAWAGQSAGLARQRLPEMLSEDYGTTRRHCSDRRFHS